MRLDTNRPYAHVYGLPGVAWQQAGRYFSNDGSEVQGDPDQRRQIGELRALLADFSISATERAAARERLMMLEPDERPEPVPTMPEPPAPEPKVGPDDLRLASNKALKAQLDIYGEAWTTAAAARAFLEGRGA